MRGAVSWGVVAANDLDAEWTSTSPAPQLPVVPAPSAPSAPSLWEVRRGSRGLSLLREAHGRTARLLALGSRSRGPAQTGRKDVRPRACPLGPAVPLRRSASPRLSDGSHRYRQISPLQGTRPALLGQAEGMVRSWEGGRVLLASGGRGAAEAGGAHPLCGGLQGAPTGARCHWEDEPAGCHGHFGPTGTQTWH